VNTNVTKCELFNISSLGYVLVPSS